MQTRHIVNEQGSCFRANQSVNTGSRALGVVLEKAAVFTEETLPALSTSQTRTNRVTLHQSECVSTDASKQDLSLNGHVFCNTS